MVAHAEANKGVQIGKYKDFNGLERDMRKHIGKSIDEVFFICIGSDRSTGDSLAPLVGTYLKEKGYNNVFGTIDDPVHAVNLDEYISKLPTDKTIIAIDACLGRLKSVGKILFRSGNLHAGSGVGKNLTPVGDFNIVGVINVSGFMEYMVLQNTRLSLVINMAKEITKAIEVAFPLEVHKDNKKENKLINWFKGIV